MASSVRHYPIDPLPADPLGKRLCQIFTYPWHAIVKENQDDASWRTITQYPLRPRELWSCWQDPSEVVGVRFGKEALHGLVDIDFGSQYHLDRGSDSIIQMRSTLEGIGINRTLLTQSSWSRGLHLWISLPNSVGTFELALTLKHCLTKAGFVLQAGQLEIFPNCKSYAAPGKSNEYQAHRLPLQPNSGSFLLDQDYSLTCGGLSEFLQQWEWCADGQDMDLLRRSIAQAKTGSRASRWQGSSERTEGWRSALEGEMAQGWTAHGQTNALLKTIACYGVVFKGFNGEDLVQFIRQKAIACAGYEQWCRHQHEIEQRASDWAKSCEGYYWKLGDPPKRRGEVHRSPPSLHNERLKLEAQERIRSAVLNLEQKQKLPATITCRAAAILAEVGGSKETLYRNLPLWHPAHYGRQSEILPPLELPKPLSEAAVHPISVVDAPKPLPVAAVRTDSPMKGVDAIRASAIDWEGRIAVPTSVTVTATPPPGVLSVACAETTITGASALGLYVVLLAVWQVFAESCRQRWLLLVEGLQVPVLPFAGSAGLWKERSALLSQEPVRCDSLDSGSLNSSDRGESASFFDSS